MLTERIAKALALAVEAHDGQKRKGTNIPYIAHPMGVASIALDHGADEDQAMAALLHDAVEDGGPDYAIQIRELFGDRVADIVEGCTDGIPDASGKKEAWKPRKERYISHLRNATDDVLLVSGSDKLHNARAIVEDLLRIGAAVFDRFSATRGQTLWYYTTLAEIFAQRETPIANALADSVQRMKQLSKSGTVAEILRYQVDHFYETLIDLLGADDESEIPELTRTQEQELMLLVISVMRIIATENYMMHPFISEFKKFGTKNFLDITMYLEKRTTDAIEQTINIRFSDYLSVFGEQSVDGLRDIDSALKKFAELANCSPDLRNRVTSIGAQKFIQRSLEDFSELLGDIERQAEILENEALEWLGDRMRAPDGHERSYGSFGDPSIGLRISPRMQRWNPDRLDTPLRWIVLRLERDFEQEHFS